MSDKEREYELLECMCRIETANKVIHKYREDCRVQSDRIMELEEQVCILESMIPNDTRGQ